MRAEESDDGFLPPRRNQTRQESASSDSDIEQSRRCRLEPTRRLFLLTCDHSQPSWPKVMSASTEPLFEPLDVFDFPPASSSSKARDAVPSFPDDEPMDFDVDAELAMFEEEQRERKGRGYAVSPPPDMEEEPEWEDEVVQTETTQMSQSLRAGGTLVTQTSTVETTLTFGESDILGTAVASCESLRDKPTSALTMQPPACDCPRPWRLRPRWPLLRRATCQLCLRRLLRAS